MLAQIALVSMLSVITIAQSQAHEIRPAVADVTLDDTQIGIQIRLTAESLLAGIDLTGLQDTDEAPEAEKYDELRALGPVDLEAQIKASWSELVNGFVVLAGETPVALTLDTVSFEDPGDLELPRDTLLGLSAALPNDGSLVQVGWQASNGPLIVRQADAGNDAYAGYLEGGEMSEPLPREGAVREGASAVFFRYIVEGFEHIIPKGLDHILFVLGLFFLSFKLRPLVTQVTVFTIAHTITLALASLGYISVNPAIVEPLIAASIVYVAVENLFTTKVTWWRPIVIFGFGLLHGMGFASVLSDVGLAPGRFVVGLIGFNIGVEIGQLTVIALAIGLIWLAVRASEIKRLDPLEETIREHEVMYQGIAIPGSIIIALIGAWWAFERVFL